MISALLEPGLETTGEARPFGLDVVARGEAGFGEDMVKFVRSDGRYQWRCSYIAIGEFNVADRHYRFDSCQNLVCFLVLRCDDHQKAEMSFSRSRWQIRPYYSSLIG